jgi:hypothetical protein
MKKRSAGNFDFFDTDYINLKRVISYKLYKLCKSRAEVVVKIF